MRAQIALSINQMKGLEALGIDISDASMMWINNMFSGKEEELILFSNTLYLIKPLDPTPAYTLEDIVLKLPDCSLEEESEKQCKPAACGCHFKGECEFSGETPMDAAYSMLLWAASHCPEEIRTLKRT